MGENTPFAKQSKEKGEGKWSLHINVTEGSGRALAVVVASPDLNQSCWVRY